MTKADEPTEEEKESMKASTKANWPALKKQMLDIYAAMQDFEREKTEKEKSHESPQLGNPESY